MELTLSGYLATSSLDGFIRIWSLFDFKLLTELQDLDSRKGVDSKPINGVRTLCYTPDFGGNLISTGYQQYLNIWSPDCSLSKSFISKLEGHTGIVVSAKVFPDSPNCVSIDDRFNIKIWDLRNFMCIQTVRTEM